MKLLAPSATTMVDGRPQSERVRTTVAGTGLRAPFTCTFLQIFTGHIKPWLSIRCRNSETPMR